MDETVELADLLDAVDLALALQLKWSAIKLVQPPEFLRPSVAVQASISDFQMTMAAATGGPASIRAPQAMQTFASLLSL